MNFLLGKVNTDFFSYMQCDDFLLVNYYEEVVQCMETNLRATNCYPEAVTMVNMNSRKVFIHEQWCGAYSRTCGKVALGMLFDGTICKQAASNTLHLSIFETTDVRGFLDPESGRCLPSSATFWIRH
jgi:hypothetical protein